MQDEHEKKEPNEYKTNWELLKRSKGIFVPGGFGYRGVEGKIKAIKYARENKIPFLGVCLGFQLAVVETCRNVLGWNAWSQEFEDQVTNDEDLKLPIMLMPDIDKENMGGTLRLGSKLILIE